jgi:uncharacterized protein YbjT (DUF2867 family)
MTGMPRQTVVVAGATGRLGTIVHTLLARGHRVRALTRTPHSPGAAALRDAGAEVRPADFDEPASIVAAARGADAMFATGTAHRVGPEGEFRHGLNVVDGAARAEVGHLVFVSGDGAAPDSPIPLFRTKHRVEERIRSLGIHHTILAPVYFMENLFNPWNLPLLRAGSFPSPIPVDVPMQQAAVADVIAIAVLVIEASAGFAGQRVRIASDELSANVGADILSRAIGRSFEPERIDLDALPPALVALFTWLEREGHFVDLAALRREYPEVAWHSYADWIRSVSPRFREFCPHPVLAGPLN